MVGRGRRVAVRPRLTIALLASTAVVLAVVAITVAVLSRGSSDDRGAAAPPRSFAPSTMSSATASSTSMAPSSATASSPRARPPAHPVVTPHGQWWGVDSTEPISRTTLRNVAQWYRGARPQLWGRYLRGDYGVTPAELDYARRQHVYVYFIVGDRNCSQCNGGDVCGHDRTAAQARHDADEATRRAAALSLPAGVVLFKDIEQVASCRGEPTRDYLVTWYRSVQGTAYRTGFYGNVHKQYYDFPVGYCAAVAADPAFARDVVLDMNQPEPRLGAPRGSTGPHDAPAFEPRSPSCAPKDHTVIWQYGESVDRDNLTDVDEAVAGVHGLLAPDGGVT